MSRYIEHCGKGERMRETTVRHISKEQYDHFKDDKRFIEFITDELTREISERIIQVLEASDEIIVKKPVLKVSEYPHSFVPASVEYRKSVEWEPLVRCKDCKHRKGTFHADRRMVAGGYWIYWCELDTGDPFELGRNAEDDNWFCADGERREDE